MTTRVAITSSLFVAAMLLLPFSLPSSAEVTGACLKDAKAQCPGVEAGGGQIKDCLKTHIKDLSDDCKAVVVKFKVITATACADDTKKYCGDVKPGEGRLEACMKSHIHEVSDACKVAMVNLAAGE
jgi:hypothetical protein